VLTPSSTNQRTDGLASPVQIAASSNLTLRHLFPATPPATNYPRKTPTTLFSTLSTTRATHLLRRSVCRIISLDPYVLLHLISFTRSLRLAAPRLYYTIYLVVYCLIVHFVADEPSRCACCLCPRNHLAAPAFRVYSCCLLLSDARTLISIASGFFCPLHSLPNRSALIVSSRVTPSLRTPFASPRACVPRLPCRVSAYASGIPMQRPHEPLLSSFV
jgi:hypothetical protein